MISEVDIYAPARRAQKCKRQRGKPLGDGGAGARTDGRRQAEDSERALRTRHVPRDPLLTPPIGEHRGKKRVSVAARGGPWANSRRLSRESARSGDVTFFAAEKSVRVVWAAKKTHGV